LINPHKGRVVTTATGRSRPGGATAPPTLAHSMGVIFSAPVLPPDVATIAGALESTGQLDWLVTRWCFTRAELPFARKLPVKNSWLRRPPAPVSTARLRRLPAADLRNFLGRWLDQDRIQTTDKSFQLVDAAAATLMTGNTTAILGREDACLSCFRRGEELDLPRIYQLPTAHFATVQRLLSRERDLFPEAFAAGELEADFAGHRLERKAAELRLATHVLCPSSFVGESLQIAGILPTACVKVLPLGIDSDFMGSSSLAREPVFLYVGTINARKGVHRLIKVWKQLRAYKTHRLRLIGDLRLPRSFVADYNQAFEHIPRLPRTSLAAEYSKAQAFVFNALADGFGHVFAEAMACATPVLASRNSGAPDLINHGEEGWIFDYDDGALAAALDRALSSSGELRQMGERARRRALEWTYSHFARSFLSWIGSILKNNAQGFF
jgi:glycosyltransferase involved in cell wall biosynthesis